jgi:para-nitrobenzyl esterase
LAKKGAVYVNFNYRLGIFGNLALPELTAESPRKASGNYQLLDIIYALDWVQHNIARFGGDPANVTISGQSSGGIEMGLLNVSPLAKGLFGKIVAQSGWPGPSWNIPGLAAHEQNGLKVMAATGAANLAELRGKSMQEMLDAVALPEIRALQPSVVEPCIDGYALPDKPDNIFAQGKHNDVPVIAGYTAGESSPSSITIVPSETVAAYQTNLQAVFGDYWQAVFNLFPAATDTDVAAALARLRNAASSGRSSVYHATNVVANGKSSAWVYVFSRPQNGAIAPHGSDNQFWHGEVLAPTSAGLVYTRNEWDYRLADIMMDTLLAFARTGDPSTADVPWPRYNPANAEKQRLNFGDASVYVDWDAGLDFFATTWLQK